MPRLVAFLRAINVGGHTVTMANLRTLFEALGLDEVETFIASGNVVFSSSTKSLPALEKRIENHLASSLGYEVKTFIRSEADVVAVARYKPFSEARTRSAGAVCVGFLAEPLAPAEVKALMAMRTDIDDFHVHSREVYWICATRQSESKFSNMAFERALKVRTTFRGINTVTRLADRLGARGGPKR